MGFREYMLVLSVETLAARELVEYCTDSQHEFGSAITILPCLAAAWEFALGF